MQQNPPDIIDVILVPAGISRAEVYKFAMQLSLLLLGIALGEKLDYPQSIMAGTLILLTLKLVIPYIVSFLTKFSGET